MTMGLKANADGSGAIQVGGSDAITISTGLASTFAAGVSGTTGSFSGNMSFNSGYGSAAVAYGCRAWVNFNGTGTPAIRASGNVTSLTDNGTGDYTVNFTTAMPDANYQYSGSFSPNYGVVYPAGMAANTNTSAESAPTTSAFRIVCVGVNSSLYDPKYVNIAVFR